MMRYLYLLSAAAFFISVLVQVFLAGMAIFIGPANWSRHVSFVHAFEYLPLVMLLLGWLEKTPKRLLWQSAGLFGLVFLQYFTANMRTVNTWVAATHPVTALLITGLALVAMLDAWKFVKGGGKA